MSVSGHHWRLEATSISSIADAPCRCFFVTDLALSKQTYSIVKIILLVYKRESETEYSLTFDCLRLLAITDRSACMYNTQPRHVTTFHRYLWSVTAPTSINRSAVNSSTVLRDDTIIRLDVAYHGPWFPVPCSRSGLLQSWRVTGFAGGRLQCLLVLAPRWHFERACREPSFCSLHP